MSFRILSAALWVASALFVVTTLVALASVDAERIPLIGNMFARAQALDKAVPLIILGVFAWVLAEIGIKYALVKEQHSAVVEFQSQVAKAELLLPVEAGRSGETRALKRARLIADCNKGNISALHDALPASAALDAGAIASGYTSLGVYAWALPVLGFIGTASGMATAIAGFKGALSGTNVQIDTLAAQLSQTVIPGLATAFETTIFALAATLVTFVCTSALRSFDQEALDQLDHVCVTFLSQIPRPDSGGVNTDAQAFERISLQLQEAMRVPIEIRDAALAMEASAQKLLAATEESHAASRSMQAAADQLAAAGKQLEDYASAPLNITVTRGQNR